MHCMLIRLLDDLETNCGNKTVRQKSHVLAFINYVRMKFGFEGFCVEKSRKFREIVIYAWTIRIMDMLRRILSNGGIWIRKDITELNLIMEQRMYENSNYFAINIKLQSMYFRTMSNILRVVSAKLISGCLLIRVCGLLVQTNAPPHWNSHLLYSPLNIYIFKNKDNGE